MLIGCGCHCGDQPSVSESIPPSESTPSQSLSESVQSESASVISESASEFSFSTITNECILEYGCPVIPRRLRWTLAAGNVVPFVPCLTAKYVGEFELEFCGCTITPHSKSLSYVTRTLSPITVAFAPPAGNTCLDPTPWNASECTVFEARYLFTVVTFASTGVSTMTIQAQTKTTGTSAAYDFQWRQTNSPACPLSAITLTKFGSNPVTGIGADTGIIEPW